MTDPQMAMKIELKNIKYAAFASQETTCFTATVVIDGKTAGTVENDGHGGCNRYHPHDFARRIDAYAKTLPPLTTKYGDLAMEADLLIGELFDVWLVERDLKRLLKANKIVYVQNGKVYATRKLPGANLAALLTDPAKRLAGYTPDTKILNSMAFADALTLYRKNVG
jgi:hypothetical protein